MDEGLEHGDWPRVALVRASAGGDRSRVRERGRAAARRLIDEAMPALGARATIESETCPDCGERHGRPVLLVDGVMSEWQLSIAHHDDVSVAAIDPKRRVGVDVEGAEATPERRAAIVDVCGDAASADPVRHWARLEAVLKADGRGFRVDPTEVLFTSGAATLDGRRFAVRDMRVEPGLVAAVAVRLD